MTQQRQRVVVGMSGGVDSSVAAALLVEQGYDVIGITMRLWTVDRPEAGARQHCCSAEDAGEAAEVAAMLGIPHYTLNFERPFRERVVDYFVEEYAQGRTPNPCQACNEHIKFRALFERVRPLGAELLATGHYARRAQRDGVLQLMRAVDADKDQSYFLYTLGQNDLAHVLFPLGELSKSQVRMQARRFGLPVADKPDSEEICFIPDNRYRDFVRERVAVAPGEVVDRRGNVLGLHDGIVNFTVGQRKGLGAFGDRTFVIALEPQTNRVIAGPEPDLWMRGLRVGRVQFVDGSPPPDGARVQIKVRSKAAPASAYLHATPDGAEAVFEEPQRAISPGQAAVFYDGDVVLGGGVIDASWR